MKFFIIIPSHNNSIHLNKILCDINKLKIQKYICLIDDGSTDDTSSKYKNKVNIFLKNKLKLGKGKSIKLGIKKIISRASNNDFFILLDGDGQHKALEFKKIINLRKKVLFIGKRSFLKMPFLEILWNFFISTYISINLKKIILDSQSGFRVFDKNLAALILKESYQDFYEFDSEMLEIASKYEYKIESFSISTIYKERKPFFSRIKRAFTIIKYFIKRNFFAKTCIYFFLLILILISFRNSYLLSRFYKTYDFKYDKNIYNSFVWLKEHSSRNEVVLAEWTQGNQIVAFVENPVIATSKVYPSESVEVSERYVDLGKFFFSKNEKEAKNIIEKYNVKYVYIRKQFDILSSCKGDGIDCSDINSLVYMLKKGKSTYKFLKQIYKNDFVYIYKTQI